ncbi:MAG TPA: glycosyltransferase family 1 protein [Ktedonosporobacter sp.]|jgi:glycosyltransferase involved in cell wall biosynthesis|nr:glycosyltransferase family 1 protein [Ktedonosporobacter sp.]
METGNQLCVGIDLTAVWRRPTGIFRYATELAQALLQLRDQSTHYVLFFAREIHPDFLPLRDSFTAVISPTTNELLLKQCWFPLTLLRLQVDVMHYPAFPPPLIQPFGPRTVMTLHDCGPWRYPQALTLHGRLYFRTLLARGLRTCTRVITVSRHAKAEIGHFQGERFLDKLAIIPEAARPEFAVAQSVPFLDSVRAKYQLPERFLLAVTTLEPRKNLVTLLDACRQLRDQLGSSCPPLVIVGRKGWHCADILRYMEVLEDTVIFPGHVSDQELIALYQMATCLVFPSLYEGFGLPVLEAMLAGCPVITSDSSSLPEVAGDAALLVNPLSASEIATAIQTVWQDKALQASMSRNGRVRAAHFSWAETARLTRELYALVAHC